MYEDSMKKFMPALLSTKDGMLSKTVPALVSAEDSMVLQYNSSIIILRIAVHISNRYYEHFLV